MTGLVKYFLLFSILTFTSGCTVGRYVTNVSLGGNDSLAVEKCTAKRYENFFWNTDCSTTEVALIPSKK